MSEASGAVAIHDPLVHEDVKAPANVWPLVIILTAAMTLYIIDRQMLALLGPSISKDLGLTDSELGMLGGLGYSLVYCLFSVPWGWVADKPRVSRSGVVAASLAVFSIATALCGAVSNYAQLLLARMGVAAGEAGTIPPGQALIAESVPRHELARALAFFSLGIPLGSFFGKIGGGLLSEHFGWRAAFFLTGLPGILLALFMVYYLRGKPFGARRTRQAPKLSKALRQVFRSRTLVHVLMGNGSAQMLAAIIAFWGMVHFQRNLGMSVGEAGMWLGLQSGVTGVIGAIIGGWAADHLAQQKLGHYFTPAIWAMLIAPLFLVFAWMTDQWWLALLLTLFPIMSDNLAYGGLNAATQRLLTSDVRSTATAFMSIVTLMGVGLGITVFGMLSDSVRASLPDGSNPSEGIRYVLFASSFLFLLPAFFYWRASRSIEDELLADVAVGDVL